MKTDNCSFPTPASAADLGAVLALLGAAGLPTADVERHIDDFFVIREADRVIGVVGAEIYGANALLRSLVVEPEWRGRGVGRRLLARVIAAARSRAVRTVYLLTTSAEKFVEPLGFERCDRAAVPSAIARTGEFATLCPASAVCMRKQLATAGPAPKEAQ